MGPEPMDLAASITPLSTSTRAFSICLDKKGTVPKIKGTMAPLVPMAVPTIALVMGISRAMSITKGMLLKVFIIFSIMAYKLVFSKITSFLVITRTTPRKIPRTREKAPDMVTIVRVWHIPVISSSLILRTFGMNLCRISSILDHLNFYAFFLKVINSSFYIFWPSTKEDKHSSNQSFIYYFNVSS